MFVCLANVLFVCLSLFLVCLKFWLLIWFVGSLLFQICLIYWLISIFLWNFVVFFLERPNGQIVLCFLVAMWHSCLTLKIVLCFTITFGVGYYIRLWLNGSALQSHAEACEFSARSGREGFASLFGSLSLHSLVAEQIDMRSEISLL